MQEGIQAILGAGANLKFTLQSLIEQKAGVKMCSNFFVNCQIFKISILLKIFTPAGRRSWP